MPVVIGIVVALLFLFAGVWLLGITFALLKALIGGLVVGVVARLLLPGEERMGFFCTALLGIVGGLGGGLLGAMVGAGAILEFVLSVACAAGLISVLGMRALPAAQGRRS